MTNYFSLNQKCLMLFTNGNLIDENNKDLGFTLWEKWNFDDTIKEKWKNNENAMVELINNRNKVTGATVAFKAVLKNDFLPIKTPVGFWHDAWIAMHAAYPNGLYFLDEVTINYRIHENQQIGIISQINYTDKSFISNNFFKKYLSRKFPEFTTAILKLTQQNSLLKRLIKKIKKTFRIL
ncbi:MAG: hypothetical protein Q7U47_10835 [Paludibacter sp.]|nr:hypothetical protein [Paludibacter sp.]